MIHIKANPLRRDPALAIVLPMRILVVEDDGELGDSLVDFLRGQGHEAEIARNVPTAIQTVHSFQPDVLLVDIVLPVFDGNFLADEIRVGGATRPRLIAMTSRPDLVSRSSFDLLLEKPVYPATLLQALAEAAARVQPRPDPDGSGPVGSGDPD